MTDPLHTGRVRVEDRRFPRNPFSLHVHFAPVSPGDLPRPRAGRAQDLGAGGMAIEIDQQLIPGQLLTLNLYLPPLERLQDRGTDCGTLAPEACQAVTLFAKVVWCRPAAGRHRAGLAFVDVAPKTRKLFKHFLVEFELDEPLA